MIRTIGLLVLLAACGQHSTNSVSNAVVTEKIEVQQPVQGSVYQFSNIESLDGGILDLSAFKGKKILIVNTASRCGYTPQYKELQELSDKYKEKLVVVGFPANNFMGQEPGTNTEIKEFCSKNYGVTFPMSAKISVKGDDMAPIYKWLTQKSLNGVLDAEVSWNFNKFLIDENGKLLAHFSSKVKPLDEEIVGKL